MTRKVLFDLDGTLIDPRRRLYALFQELAPENSLSFEEYWFIKRRRVNQRDMLRRYLHYSDDRIDEFQSQWMEKIEETSRLAMDLPYEHVNDFLKKTAISTYVYLVTARQCKDRVVSQIDKLGWSTHFIDILVTEHRTTKAELIRDKIQIGPLDIFIGDTGEDIHTGRDLRIGTVAVTSGVLCKSVLKKYRPDLILDSVVELDVVGFRSGG